MKYYDNSIQVRLKFNKYNIEHMSIFFFDIESMTITTISLILGGHVSNMYVLRNRPSKLAFFTI